jgi:ketosteroid isomerase-like protein
MLETLMQRRFETLNRRDLPAIVDMWNEDAVFEFPGKTPISGRFEGKPAIEAWWRRWVARFTSVHFTVRHVGVIRVWPGANSALIAWDVDVTTTDGIRGHASGVSLMRERGGKVAFARDYFFDPEGIELIWGRAGAATPATEVPREPALAAR